MKFDTIYENDSFIRDMVYYFWTTDTENDMSTKLHWYFAEGKYQIITSQKQCLTLRSQMKECIKKKMNRSSKVQNM